MGMFILIMNALFLRCNMITKLIKEFLKSKEGISILDLGPGYSNFALEVANLTKSNKVSLFDYDNDVLNYQKEQFSAIKIDPTIYKFILDVEKLNNLSAKFDLILCQEILEHLDNPEEILTALVNLLNTDGKLIITVPTKFSELLLKTLNNNYMLNEPFGHIQLFNKKRLLLMIKNANLELDVFKSAQPHFFITHIWLFGSRMKVEGSTGKVLTDDWRNKVGDVIFSFVTRVFFNTNIYFWSNIFPRNYFIIATKAE